MHGLDIMRRRLQSILIILKLKTISNKGNIAIDFVQEIEVIDIEEDGTIWAMDKEGDEFEVLKEDLTEI